MNGSRTWYVTPSDTATVATAVAEPPGRRVAIAAGSALVVLGLGLAIAGTVDANSGTAGTTDTATRAAAATGQGCDKSTDTSPSTAPSTSPDPANA